MIQRRYRTLTLLAFGFLLTQLSSSAFLPALPSAMQTFHTDSHGIKSYLSYYFLGYALGQLCWGTLSDRFGRKAMIQIALCCFVPVTLITPYTGNLALFYVFYALMGFSSASFTSVGNAALKDLFDQQSLAKAIAIIGVVMASGPLIGPAIGTSLTHLLGWESIFWFLALYACCLFVVSSYWLPESQPKKLAHQVSVNFMKRMQHVMANRQFIYSVILLGASFAIIQALLDSLPFVLSHPLHFSPRLSGWILSCLGVSYILGAIMVIVQVKRCGITSLLQSAVLITIIAMGCFIAILIIPQTNTSLSLTTIALSMLSVGMLVPLGKTAVLTSTTQHAGTTASLMKFIQSLFALMGAAVSARLNAETNIKPLALFIVVLSVIVIVSFVVRAIDLKKPH